MPKYPYKQMGVKLDRQFRNDYNQNLKDIESDIKELGNAPLTALDAAKKAEEAAAGANKAKQDTEAKLDELKGLDVVQFNDRLVTVEKRSTDNENKLKPIEQQLAQQEKQLSQQERQTQVLEHGLSVLNGNVNAPVSLEVEGRTLVPLQNSNLELGKYYVLADKLTKIKVLPDENWKQGVTKFQYNQPFKTTANYIGKVSGSTVENPHKAYALNNSSLVAPSGFTVERPTDRYSRLAVLDGVNIDNTTANTNGIISQMLFSFDIIQAIERKLGRIPKATFSDKLQWCKDNILKLTCNWWGFGSSVGGNKASFTVFMVKTNSWWTATEASHTNSTVTKLTRSPGLVSDVIDTNGFVHSLAFAEPSDGTTSSTINTDYVDLEIELKSDAKLENRPIICKVSNFEGKVSGSTIENPNIFKVKNGSAIAKPNEFTAEGSAIDYPKIVSLDGISYNISATTNGSQAQNLFSFNVVEEIERKLGRIPRNSITDKIAWCKENIVKLTCNWYGYGSSVGGNKANLSMWVITNNGWSTPPASHTFSSVSLNKIYTFSISDKIDLNGFVHCIAYAEPSDGTTMSTIVSDYVELEIELKPDVILLDPRVPLFEVNQDEYNKILVSWDENEVLKRYPMVENVQHIQNPFVMVEGDNLIPPFYEWNLHANAKVISPYELELNATALIQISSVLVPVLSNTQYTAKLSYSSPINDATLGVVYYDAQGNVLANQGSPTSGWTLKNHPSGVFTTPSNCVNVRIQLYNLTTASGIFTFSKPMLTLGSTAKPFVPSNPLYFYAETKLGSIGDKKDILFEQDGNYLKRKNVELDVVLDGSMDWKLNGDRNGFKEIYIDLVGQKEGQLIVVKYDGTKLGYSDPIMTNTINNTGGGQRVRFGIADTDSGWNETYSPIADEIKAYFNGWQVKTADTNGKPTAWKSIVDGSDAPTQTLAYVKSNKAANYTPYKLSYVLVNPVTEEVKYEGDIILNGLTQVEVGSGVIVREKANPVLLNGIYYINRKAGDSNDNPLKHKVLKIVDIYKGLNSNLSKWQIETNNLAYGNQRLTTLQSKFDVTQDYFVTYLVLEREKFTTNITNCKATFANNIRSSLNDVVEKQGENTRDISILFNIANELLKRVKALEGV